MRQFLGWRGAHGSSLHFSASLLGLLLTAPSVPASGSDCACSSNVGSLGDPHLTLPHGGRADFRGRHDGIFNFLSAHDLSVNVQISNSSFVLYSAETSAKFTVHGTFITEAHLVGRTSKHRFFNVTFAADRGVATASCAPASEANKADPTITIGKGRGGSCDNLRIEMAPNDVMMTLTTPDWQVTIAQRRILGRISGPHQRLDLNIQLQTAEHKLPTSPHGIIGQAWDGDGLAVHGNVDEYPTTDGAVLTSYAMAEGAIEGVADDYEVASRYETGFKFSRFGTRGVPARNHSALKRCVPADIAPVGADRRNSQLPTAQRCWRGAKCVDTTYAFVGLQPAIAADCSAGLAQLVQSGHGHLLGRPALTVQMLCQMPMRELKRSLAARGVAFNIPIGIEGSAMVADACPDTCLNSGVAAQCLEGDEDDHVRDVHRALSQRRRSLRRSLRTRMPKWNGGASWHTMWWSGQSWNTVGRRMASEPAFNSTDSAWVASMDGGAWNAFDGGLEREPSNARRLAECTCPPPPLASPPPPPPPSSSPSPPPPSPAAELNNVPITPTVYGGASVSGDSIILGDNMYASLSASDLGNFGVGNFEIEVKIQANAGGGFPDLSYGALFIRSTQEAAPYTGPSSFLWSNGQVSFRMLSTAGDCRAPGAVSNWNQENTLRYQYTVSSGSCFTLKIFVNGIEKKSCSACDALTTSHFTNSAMWLGANHANHNAQSVNFRITQLRLTTSSPT